MGILAGGEEVGRLAQGFAEGSVVGFLLQLGPSGPRTASIFVDGRFQERVFSELPAMVYPAVSNMCAPAQYRLDCHCLAPAANAGADSSRRTVSASVSADTGHSGV